MSIVETAWCFPSGDRLPLPGQAGLTEARGYHRVDIRMIYGDSPSGICRCDIPTNAVHDAEDISVRDTVYVGLYVTGGNVS